MYKKKIPSFQLIAHTVLILFTIAVILPFILLFMSSITEESTLLVNGYSFFPEKFSLEAYKFIFMSSNKIIRAYGVTIFVAVVGTTMYLSLASLMAYPLSLSKLPFRRQIMFFVFFTMLFNGGLVPTYISYTTIFNIKDTIQALIIPTFMLNAFGIIIIRTYFASNIPETLYEAAQIDGASHFRIFFTIVLPLGKPILVTMGTFTGITYWNDWTNGLYYLNKRTDFYSIQNLLNAMIRDLQFLTSGPMASYAGEEMLRVPAVGVQMAIAFVAILPILMLFPFLQKYYQKGISLGAVKG
jgi:putative aldouronate transport system permease protein